MRTNEWQGSGSRGLGCVVAERERTQETRGCLGRFLRPLKYFGGKMKL